MNTIIGIRELDAYLVSFFDQNTVYNYSLLSKETNQIAASHELFKLLKEYHGTFQLQDNILSWGIANNKPYVLDWYVKLGYQFNNVFALTDSAIMYSSTKILDWFYQKGIFDYTLIALHQAVLTGAVESMDWFYDHGLEKTYLDKLLTGHGIIVNNIHSHGKLLQMLKWLHKKNYPIELDLSKLSRTMTEGSAELIIWLLDHRLIDKSIFSNNQFWFDMEDLPVEKQLEILILLKGLGYHFGDDIRSLMNSPIEVFELYIANNPHPNLINIFRSAALADKISIMKWTGINKDHPDFATLDNDYILEIAVRYFHIDVIEWYFENVTFSKQVLDDLSKTFCLVTKLTVEKIMQVEKYFEKYNYPCESIYPNLIENAVEGGNLLVLEYLLTKLPPNSVVYIYDRHIQACISNGKIDILRWLEKYLHDDFKQDKELVQIIYKNELRDFADAINSATLMGHLETIKWVKHVLPHKFNYKRAIDNASQRWHVDILNWFDELFGNSPEFEYTAFALDNSVLVAELKTLKWFHKSNHTLKYSNNLIENAICYKKIHVLQWLKDNGYPMIFNTKSICIACTSFSESLQWLKDNGVIKILSREMVNDLLVFKIELAQPFAETKRSNVIHKIADLFPSINNFVEVCPVEKISIITSGYKPRIVEIKYKYDKIHSISAINLNVMEDSHYSIYHSLYWFERWCKLSKIN